MPLLKKLLTVERDKGIEPSFSAWKAGVIPLYESRMIVWWAVSDSNTPPKDYESSALT
jgi:hypothetical protein